MIKNYNFIILICFCFLQNSNLLAQYKQYKNTSVEEKLETKHKISSAAREEPFNYTIKFNSINDLMALDNAMRLAQKKALNEWLAKQEGTLEKAIENTLHKSFSGFRNAQKAMFKAFEENKMRTKYKASDLASSYYKTASTEARLRDNYTAELLMLKYRKSEINQGKINQSDIGDFKIQGVRIKDIRSIAKHDELRVKAVSSFGKHHLKSSENYAIEKGIMKVGWKSDILIDKLVQDRISHYNSRSTQDKIGLMTAYLISYNQQSILEYPPILSQYRIPNYATNSYILQIANQNSAEISGSIKAFDPIHCQNLINMAAAGLIPNIRPENMAKILEDLRESEIRKMIGNPPSNTAITLSELKSFDDYLQSGNFNPINSPWLKKAREYAEKVYKLKDQIPDYLEKEMMEAVDESFIFALKETALYMNPKANITSEPEKITQFRDNGKNGVAILLYEFATGTGANIRDFPFDYDMTKQMLAGNVPSDIKKDFLNQLSKRGATFEEFVEQNQTIAGSYAFSPDHTNVQDSFNKHVKANWVQFFIGGASAKYSPSPDVGWINVELSNGTSRSSLILHIAENYPRSENGKNRPLSTIKQTFKFKLKIK